MNNEENDSETIGFYENLDSLEKEVDSIKQKIDKVKDPHFSSGKYFQSGELFFFQDGNKYKFQNQ